MVQEEETFREGRRGRDAQFSVDETNAQL